LLNKLIFLLKKKCKNALKLKKKFDYQICITDVQTQRYKPSSNFLQ